ncbi:MAG: DUF3145 family protein [Micrococcales bacterium]
MEYPFSGEVFIHAVAKSQARQVEWMLAEIMDYQIPLTWSPQPVMPDHVKSGFAWQGAESSGAEISSALAGWQKIYFEVTQDANGSVGSSRWLYVPEFGIKHRATDEFGNYSIGEDELRAALARGSNSMTLAWEVQNLLAQQWEQILEPLRSQLFSKPSVSIQQVG